jgi:ribonucleoside-diphosphate reductase alpha chain
MDKQHLQELRQEVVKTNKEHAKKLKINPAAATTCVKPSGTVSQLVDAASGIHTRHSPYYIRTVRVDNKDPIRQFMVDKGFPNEPEMNSPDNITVFSFPHKSPKDAITRNDRTALESLHHWRTIQNEWTEHKPSITVNVRENEWFSVGSWVWENFDDVSGVAFLPHTDHNYKQAPYQECTEEEYKGMLALMPKDVDWQELQQYEKEDNTTGSQELSCVAGICEMVDVGV